MAQETSIQKKTGSNVLQTEDTRSGWHYRPMVDITEDANELTLWVDMPGATGDSIDLRFENGLMTMQGHVDQRQAGNTEYLVHEYGVGNFFRTFQIGEIIDSGRISAAYGEGVLTVHLPKSETARPRRIEVQKK